MNSVIRIIGIDPGLQRMGWGVIESQSGHLGFIASGTIRSDPKADLAQRLVVLHQGITTVLSKHCPCEAAVEETFVNKDARATLKLGQARAIAMLAPAQAKLEVFEYAPNRIKKTVVGAGHADKKQIRTMVSMLLPKATFDSDDAADALAIAICHAQSRSVQDLRIAASF